MAIHFFRKCKEWFGSDFQDQPTLTATVADISAKVAIRELAYQICVLRVAKALSKCEFRTFTKKGEEKADLYYLLNVKPNPQQGAAEFWQDFVQTLYYRKEALIVPLNECLYLADSYSIDKTPVTKGWKITNVTIGDMKLRRSYTTEDAFYFTLKDGNITSLLDQTTAMYGDLVTAATQAYRKSNASKMKLKISRTAENADGFEEDLQKMLQEDIKTFVGSDSAVYPEYDGYELSGIDVGGGKGSDSRDITAILNDVLQITCKAFLMPVNIALGEVADTSTAINDFLSFCLEPLTEQIAQGFNRAYFDKEEYLSGSHITINTQTVEHVGILSASVSIDKLIGCGVQSVNDILRILREAPISEEWADKHFITKNYASMDNAGLDPESEDPGKEGT